MPHTRTPPHTAPRAGSRRKKVAKKALAGQAPIVEPHADGVPGQRQLLHTQILGPGTAALAGRQQKEHYFDTDSEIPQADELSLDGLSQAGSPLPEGAEMPVEGDAEMVEEGGAEMPLAGRDAAPPLSGGTHRRQQTTLRAQAPPASPLPPPAPPSRCLCPLPSAHLTMPTPLSVLSPASTCTSFFARIS